MDKKTLFVFILLIVVSLAITTTGAAEDVTPPAPEDYPKPVAYPWLILEDYVDEPDGGVGDYEPKVIGGRPYSPENRFPFIVSLQFDGDHYCGGTLIDPEWVLTSAHCWTDTDGTEFDPDPVLDRVVLGEYQLSFDSGNEQRIAIADVYRHPAFDYEHFLNDIALLKLSTPAVINDYVQTIVLPDIQFNGYRSTAWVLGWGVLNFGDLIGSDYIQMAEIEILHDTYCSTYGVAFDGDTMLCAGDIPLYEKDTCKGDSGGPLFVKYGVGWIQMGVTSWGNECAKENFPGVYARLPKYADWIDTTMNETVAPADSAVAPADGGTVYQIAVPLYWNASPDNPLGYQVKLYSPTDSLLEEKFVFTYKYCGMFCKWRPTTELPEDDGYYWTVQAYKVGYGWSTLSTYTFNVHPWVRQLSPLNGDTLSAGNLTFTWKPVFWEATQYRILTYDDTGGGHVNNGDFTVDSSVCVGYVCTFVTPTTYSAGDASWQISAYKDSIGWISFSTLKHYEIQ